MTLVREPFEIGADAEIARRVRDAAAAVTGTAAAIEGHWAWMDAAILAAAGIPTVVYGPRGDGAHALEEWVDLGDVERCARVYAAVAAVAAAFCAWRARPCS